MSPRIRRRAVAATIAAAAGILTVASPTSSLSTQISGSATSTSTAERNGQPVVGDSPVCPRKWVLQPGDASDRANLLEFDPLVFAQRVPTPTIRELTLIGEYPNDLTPLASSTDLIIDPGCTLAIGRISSPDYTHVVIDLDLGDTFEFLDLGSPIIQPTLWGFVLMVPSDGFIDALFLDDDPVLVSYPFQPGDSFLDMSIDGRAAAILRDGEILVYENESIGLDPVLRVPTGGLLQGVEFSPSGQQLVIFDELPRPITHSDQTSDFLLALTIVDIRTGIQTTLEGIDPMRFEFVTDDLFVTCGQWVHRFDGTTLRRVRRSSGTALEQEMCLSF